MKSFPSILIFGRISEQDLIYDLLPWSPKRNSVSIIRIRLRKVVKLQALNDFSQTNSYYTHWVSFGGTRLFLMISRSLKIPFRNVIWLIFRIKLFICWTAKQPTSRQQPNEQSAKKSFHNFFYSKSSRTKNFFVSINLLCLLNYYIFYMNRYFSNKK